MKIYRSKSVEEKTYEVHIFSLLCCHQLSSFAQLTLVSTLKKRAEKGKKTWYSVTPAVHQLVYWSGWKTAGTPEASAGGYITVCPSQHSTLTCTLPLQAASPSSREQCAAHSCPPSVLTQPLDLVVVLVCVVRNKVMAEFPSYSLLILIVSRHFWR